MFLDNRFRLFGPTRIPAKINPIMPGIFNLWEKIGANKIKENIKKMIAIGSVKGIEKWFFIDFIIKSKKSRILVNYNYFSKLIY